MIEPWTTITFEWHKNPVKNASESRNLSGEKIPPRAQIFCHFKQQNSFFDTKVNNKYFI